MKSNLLEYAHERACWWERRQKYYTIKLCVSIHTTYFVEAMRDDIKPLSEKKRKKFSLLSIDLFKEYVKKDLSLICHSQMQRLAQIMILKYRLLLLLKICRKEFTRWGLLASNIIIFHPPNNRVNARHGNGGV